VVHAIEFGIALGSRNMADLQEIEHESFPLPRNKDIPIWRYMDLAKYLSMMHRRCLFFSRATLLGDPFEGSSTKAMVVEREYIRANRASDPTLTAYKDMSEEYFTQQLPRLPKEMVQKYLVNCWHMNEHESAAMWKLYSSSQEAICIQSTYRRLRTCLPQCVFIGKVRYIDYETEGFGAGNLFNFIMHKRMSFVHERELRAIFWEMNGIPEAEPHKKQIEPAGLAMRVDLSELIENVFVSPTASSWFVEIVKSVTGKYGFALSVGQSSLAASPLY
jgi:hypothetical protein